MPRRWPLRIRKKTKTSWIQTPAQKWHQIEPGVMHTKCGVPINVRWSPVTEQEPPPDALICKNPECRREV